LNADDLHPAEADLAAHNMPPTPQKVETASFEDSTLRESLDLVDLVDCTFRDIVWHGTLRRVRFVRCRLVNVQWHSTYFEDVCWDDCVFERVRFEACSLDRCNFTGGTAKGIGLRKSALVNCTSSQAEWEQLLLAESTVEHWALVDCKLGDVEFSEARVIDLAIAECEVTDLRMYSLALMRLVASGSKLHSMILVDCAGSSNQWIGCELRLARYEGVRLRQCGWTRSEWRDGHFLRSNLELAAFNEAVLHGVQWIESPCDRLIFDGARLADCRLNAQSMPGLSLRDATLDGVDLRGLQARGLDARGARFNGTRLDGVDASGAVLIGQLRSTWRGAKLPGARFEEEPDLRDDAWWETHKPGPNPKE